MFVGWVVQGFMEKVFSFSMVSVLCLYTICSLFMNEKVLLLELVGETKKMVAKRYTKVIIKIISLNMETPATSHQIRGIYTSKFILRLLNPCTFQY